MCHALWMPVFAVLTALASPAAAAPVQMPGTQELVLKSLKGAEYRIWVSEPVGPVPESGGYRVLYVLDGNAFFSTFDALKRLKDDYAGTIVVGVGYPTKEPYDLHRRTWDFTPPARDDKWPQGGQDEFLDFIEKTLKPAIAARYKVDAKQETLFGHSFGGMFALYAMYTRPGLFDHYVSVSSTLWWMDRYLLPYEQTFVAKVERREIDVRNISIMLAIGDAEPAQEVQDTVALERRLQSMSVYGLRTTMRLQPEEDHMTVTSALAARVLRDVWTAQSH